MKKTPLYDRQPANGAVFGEYSGWLIPKSYGNIPDECKTVRNSAGISDLSHRGKLVVSGKEHTKFLQGILSNDVYNLDVGKGMYATLLTVKGRIITDMKVYRDKDAVFLDIEPGQNDRIKELMNKIKLSYKANVDDLTDSLILLSINGPCSSDLIKKIFGENLPQLNEYDFTKRDFMGSEITIIKANRTGEEGYDILLSSNASSIKIWEALISNGKELNIVPVGMNALETLRIEAGIPRYGIDMDENTIPIEAGIWNALNFEKGCYVGQEVIARIKWRGHVNRHLVGLIIEGQELPNQGDKINSGEKDIGNITSSTFSPHLNKSISLGYIRREYKEPGTPVFIKRDNNSLISAKVSDTPLYK